MNINKEVYIAVLERMLMEIVNRHLNRENNYELMSFLAICRGEMGYTDEFRWAEKYMQKTFADEMKVTRILNDAGKEWDFKS